MGKPIIQCTCLGNFGRFGNQLFQYLFARAYAEKYNAVLEVPEWIGERIFKNVSHRRPSCRLFRTHIDRVPWGQVNIDLLGYFQKQQFIDILSESKIRDWLQFQDRWAEYFINLKHIVVVHLRRGDYLTKYLNKFCVISKESYENAFDKFNVPKGNIIWMSEKEQVTWRNLDKELDFLPDFFGMIQAQYLFRANSTFSLWAGFFNKNKVYSPLVGNKVGNSDVEFVKGNSPALTPRAADFILKN